MRHSWKVASRQSGKERRDPGQGVTNMEVTVAMVLQKGAWVGIQGGQVPVKVGPASAPIGRSLQMSLRR